MQSHILESFAMFLKHFKRIRPEMLCRHWVFHWDNESVHTAVVVQEFMDKKSIQLIGQPLYSLDLVPSDFTLFPKIKTVLAGTLNAQDSLKKTWDAVLRTPKTTSPRLSRDV